MKWGALAARLILCGTFLYAALTKMGDSRQFAMALAPFAHLPAEWLRPLSLALIVAETLTGVLVVLPRVYPLGAAAALVLCLLYAGVIWWGVANGIIVNCDCFGTDEAPSAEKMVHAIIRDFVLAGLACLILSRWRKSAAAGTSAATI